MSEEFVIFNCHKENVLDIEYKNLFIIILCGNLYLKNPAKKCEKNTKNIVIFGPV